MVRKDNENDRDHDNEIASLQPVELPAAAIPVLTLELLRKIHHSGQATSRIVEDLLNLTEARATEIAAIKAGLEIVNRDAASTRNDLSELFRIVLHNENSHSVRLSVAENNIARNGGGIATILQLLSEREKEKKDDRHKSVDRALVIKFGLATLFLTVVSIAISIFALQR